MYSELQKIDLFAGLNEEETIKAMDELRAQARQYQKGDIVLHAGDKVTFIGIILYGGIEISRQDIEGNRFILNQLQAPTMFGEALVCGGIDSSPVTLTVTKVSKILWIDFQHVINNNKARLAYQQKLLENMLRLLAMKVQFLSSRLDLLCKRTIRAKLAAYLLSKTEQNRLSQIKIPFNREELADYLCTNRSALSRELCKMKEAGVLDFRKNNFVINDPSELCRWSNMG